jgi:hypothetical protein
MEKGQAVGAAWEGEAPPVSIIGSPGGSPSTEFRGLRLDYRRLVFNLRPSFHLRIVRSTVSLRRSFARTRANETGLRHRLVSKNERSHLR